MDRKVGGEPVYRGMLGIDIERYSRAEWTDPIRARIRRRLYRLLDAALVGARIDPAQVTRFDGGDGLWLIVAPEVSAARLLHPLASDLIGRLVEDNRNVPETERMRLRMVVHAGYVIPDAAGQAGASIVHAARLLDADAGRVLLAEAVAATAVLIVSEEIHWAIVRQGYEGIDPAGWQSVDISVKETTARAWVHVPGVITQPSLPDRTIRPVERSENRVWHRLSTIAIWLNLRPRAPSPAEVTRARADLVNEIDRGWIQELSRSLYQVARIELGLAERPSAVDDPLRAILRRPGEPDRLLEQGTSIEAIYRQLGRQLLILGIPGGGKTTLLIELARALLHAARTEETERIPVVFHLSTWAAERRPLATWLVDELQKRYGVARALAALWIASEQIIPLLDGLDEVAAAYREACVSAVNTFHERHGQLPIVICSRVQEYEALQARLQLRGAIVIQPLTRAEVEEYLDRAGKALRHVRVALDVDAQLWELLTTPLFLSVVALAYQGRAPAAAAGTMDQRRREVWADYVEAMLRRPRASHYTRADTLAWLAWLARSMQARDQTVFSPDWMQPDLLPTAIQRWLVATGISIAIGALLGLLFGVAFGAVVGAVSRPILGLDPGLVGGSVLGACAGIAFGLSAHERNLSPRAELRWSWAALMRNLPRWLLAGLVTGLVLGLVVGWRAWIRLGLLGLGAALAGALISGVILGIWFGVVSALEARLDVAPTAPGRAIEVSRRNAVVSGLTTWLVGGTIGGIGAGAVFGLASLFVGRVTATTGLGAGLVSGMAIGLTGRLILGLDAGFGRGLRSVLIVSAGAAAAGGLAGCLAAAPVDSRAGGLAAGMVIGLGSGVIVALQRGGSAYLRHQALRWLLARAGVMPGDPVEFLDHVTSLVLMRRQGGGYLFVHRMLLEHFATGGPRRPGADNRARPRA